MWIFIAAGEKASLYTVPEAVQDTIAFRVPLGEKYKHTLLPAAIRG